MSEHTADCEQDDHDRVWQLGREAGYRDALIALAEHRGAFFDELDRHIADSLRRDREYVGAHDAATLRAAAEAWDALQTPENDLHSRRDPALWLHNLADTVADSEHHTPTIRSPNV